MPVNFDFSWEREPLWLCASARDDNPNEHGGSAGDHPPDSLRTLQAKQTHRNGLLRQWLKEVGLLLFLQTLLSMKITTSMKQDVIRLILFLHSRHLNSFLIIWWILNTWHGNVRAVLYNYFTFKRLVYVYIYIGFGYPGLNHLIGSLSWLDLYRDWIFIFHRVYFCIKRLWYGM